MSDGTQLVRYDAMCHAIAAAYSVDEVKDIRDKARAIEVYARQAKNTEAERQACEIRLRAERKTGQLSAQLETAEGSRTDLTSSQVAHGDWLPWLDREFGWHEATARRYMQVAQAFQNAQPARFGGLTIDATALYALSAPDVPQEARDEAVERAEDGEHISKADAEALDLQAEDDKPPDIPTLVDKAHLQHLACILGTAITDGSKVYPPTSLEETRQAEERLRISAPALRALEYFLAAPDPDVVIDALRPFQADTARRCVAVAVAWIGDLNSHLGSK